MNRPVKLEKANIGDIFSLTPLQEGMLFYYLRDPQGDMFFEQVSLRIDGSVDPNLAQSAWARVVEGNGMLRAVFRWENMKRPVQVVLKSHQPDVRVVDFSVNTEDDPETLFQEFLACDRSEKFDLQRVPFRVSICRFSDSDHRIVLSHHHIIYDGWSTGILLEEFFIVYRQMLKEESCELKQKMPFSRFVKWLNRNDLQVFGLFWNRYLDGLAGGACPPKKSVTKTIADFSEHQRSLPTSLQRSVDSFALRLKVTPAALYYAAWGLLLQRYGGKRDVLFDTTVAGRPPDLEGADDVVGLFINTIPCRVKARPDDSIGEFLSGFQSELRERQKYENVPLRNLDLPFTEGNQDLFRSLVVMENYPVDKRLAETSSDLQVKSISNYGINDYDLTVLIKAISGVEFQFIYYNGLFESGDIDNITKDYCELLESIVAAPVKSVQELTVSRDADKRMLEKITSRQEEVSCPLNDGDILPPRTVTEARLQKLFAAVLRFELSSIGIENDFFQFGGHSLRASQLVSRILQEFNVQVPLIEVFHLKTVSNIAAYIDRKAGEIILPVTETESREYYPLSSAQTRMFVLHQEENVGTTYNIPRSFIVEGDLDISRLEAAFQSLVQRHESLRTIFCVNGSQPVQKVLANVEFNLRRIDDVGLSLDEAIQRFIRPYDLSCPPLIRAGLASLCDNRFLLVIDIHHIISDGFSNFLLLRDLISLYRGDPLPSLRIQYKDFVHWESRFKVSPSFDNQRKFWLDQFETMPVELNFPSLKRDRSFSGFEGDAISFDISEDLTAGIRGLATATNTTVFNVMLAAYYVLLSKYTRQEDIVVGFPVTGRSRVEFTRIVGMFVNMLPLRCFPRIDQSFVEFLNQVRDSVWSAMENQDFPFNEMVLGLGLSGDRGKNPLFRTAFVMHDMNRAAVDLENIDLDSLYLEEPSVRMNPYLFGRNASAFEFQMVAREKSRSIEMAFEFSTDVLARETSEKIIQRYREILENVVRNPNVTSGKIEISTEYEKVCANRIRKELEDFDF